MRGTRSAGVASTESSWFCRKLHCRPPSLKKGLRIILSRYAQLSLAVFAICASSTVQAQTYSQVINAATCIPFPVPTVPPEPFVFAYQHYLFGNSATAFCQLTMSSDWPVSNLSYVLISGSVPQFQSITASLCVHTGFSTFTCGSASTISGDSVALVYPPSLPDSAAGAFVRITFPGITSRLFELVPVWSK